MTFPIVCISCHQALALLHIVGTLGREVTPRYEKKLDWLRGLLGNIKEELRETVAAVLGLVTGPMVRQDFERAMKDVAKVVREKGLEYQHGAVLALGQSLGRHVLLARMEGRHEDWSQWTVYRDICNLVISQLATLNTSQNLLVSAACLALAELGRCCYLYLNINILIQITFCLFC